MFDWKNIAVRALVTFVQGAAAAFLALTVTGVDVFSPDVWIVAAGGGVAACMSLAYNASSDLLDNWPWSERVR